MVGKGRLIKHWDVCETLSWMRASLAARVITCHWSLATCPEKVKSLPLHSQTNSSFHFTPFFLHVPSLLILKPVNFWPWTCLGQLPGMIWLYPLLLLGGQGSIFFSFFVCVLISTLISLSLFQSLHIFTLALMKESGSHLMETFICQSWSQQRVYLQEHDKRHKNRGHWVISESKVKHESHYESRSWF